jgi:hypothetical protein
VLQILRKIARSGVMKKFTLSEAMDIARQLGIDFKKVKFTPEEYLEGINIELEHGTVDPDTNVSMDDPLVTGKIALAHLNEVPLYYNEDIGLEAWEHAIEAFTGDPKGKKIQIV